MIENELEKGFEDLSTLRVYITMRGVSPTNPGTVPTSPLQAFVVTEQKWGVWRPYLIQDKVLEDHCESYRAQIRDLRVGVIASQDPRSMEANITTTEDDMRAKSRTIVAELDRRKW